MGSQAPTEEGQASHPAKWWTEDWGRNKPNGDYKNNENNQCIEELALWKDTQYYKLFGRGTEVPVLTDAH